MFASLNDLIGQLWDVETDIYPDGEPFVNAVRSGTMSVELFAPRGEDLQQPHEQDELYIVINGTATLDLGDDEIRCAGGDVLFVEAEAKHRFVDMSNDFMTWAVFWGPPGGEVTA